MFYLFLFFSNESFAPRGGSFLTIAENKRSLAGARDTNFSREDYNSSMHMNIHTSTAQDSVLGLVYVDDSIHEAAHNRYRVFYSHRLLRSSLSYRVATCSTRSVLKSPRRYRYLHNF